MGGEIWFVLPQGRDRSDQKRHQEGPCHTARDGRERGPCTLSAQLHLSRAMLAEANWPLFPQHDLVLNLRAHPEGMQLPWQTVLQPYLFFSLFKTRFLQKRLIKPTCLTSEPEERPTAAVATHGGGREMLPPWMFGGLGQVQGCGAHSSGRDSSGMPHCVSRPSERSCLLPRSTSVPPRQLGA